MAGAKTLTPGGIDGLVRLLADDDEKIRKIARDHLAAAGDRALEIVRERARGAEDPRVREAADEFLRASAREEALVRWAGMGALPVVDLQEGCFLLARSEHPEIDTAPYLHTLDEYAEVLRRRMGAVRTPGPIFDRISALLFTELGYRGNRENYYEPDNSFLPRVMDRKLGIPISLSALFILVARRLDQKIEGVGMPGHFLLRYRSGKTAVFIDPFHQGRRWTYADCLAHLEARGLEFREEYLRALDDRDILRRMLGNLLQIYHSVEDRERTERITRMLSALRGTEEGT